MAVGKAIDSTLARYSHEFSRGLRPTVGAMTRFAATVMDEELRDIDLPVGTSERAAAQVQISAVLQAFRKTVVFGLPRPKTRMVLIDEQVGVYTQPDYWDRVSRFYEMKSYRAIPPPPDVVLQLRLFQLGFVGFDGFLVCVNRHATPPDVSITPVLPMTGPESQETLLLARQIGLEIGTSKVLEFIDSPVVRYSTGEFVTRSDGP